MASVTLEDVKKEYGDVTAVDNMSLEIRDGEFVTGRLPDVVRQCR